ncbi:hypothetical protein BC829DRAFT_447776 [Chytridium lagenaria]|nr:hypothetical protein BC829DRAFT_447776 [Chytridium lagenaria]
MSHDLFAPLFNSSDDALMMQATAAAESHDLYNGGEDSLMDSNMPALASDTSSVYTSFGTLPLPSSMSMSPAPTEFASTAMPNEIMFSFDQAPAPSIVDARYASFPRTRTRTKMANMAEFAAPSPVSFLPPPSTVASKVLRWEWCKSICRICTCDARDYDAPSNPSTVTQEFAAAAAKLVAS